MDVIAKIVLKKKYKDVFDEGMEALVRATLEEPGCLRFEVYEDRDEECVYWLVERWRNHADLEDHYAQPYVRALIDNYDEWLEEPLSVTKLSEFQH